MMNDPKSDMDEKLKEIKSLFDGYVNAYDSHKKAHLDLESVRFDWKERVTLAERLMCSLENYISEDGAISIQTTEEILLEYRAKYFH